MTLVWNTYGMIIGIRQIPCLIYWANQTIDTCIFLYVVSSRSPLFAVWSFCVVFQPFVSWLCAELANDSVFVRTLTIGRLIKWRVAFAADMKHAIWITDHVFSTFICPSYWFIMLVRFVNRFIMLVLLQVEWYSMAV